MGIATVYRNLRTFVDEGTIRPVALPGEPDRYELSTRSACHHFRCRACSRVFDVPKSAVQSQAPFGFEVETARVVLDGVCAECNPLLLKPQPMGQPTTAIEPMRPEESTVRAAANLPAPPPHQAPQHPAPTIAELVHSTP